VSIHQVTDPPKPPIGVNFSAACQQLRIVNCTKHAAKCGFRYRVGLSRALFSVLWPVAQDANKSETFEERLEIMLKEFKRNAEFAISDSILFKITIGTIVSEYKTHDEIHEHRKMTKEDMEILAMSPDDERGEPCLLFFHKAEYDKYRFKEILAVSTRSAIKG